MQKRLKSFGSPGPEGAPSFPLLSKKPMLLDERSSGRRGPAQPGASNMTQHLMNLSSKAEAGPEA